jgi:prepilin-type N-terminal cleavage/methylation domain-containing protein
MTFVRPKSAVRPRTRRGFTLIELMITITIIALMAGMLVFALFSAQETAKAHKTKALIAKLDAIIKAKYEAYKTRRVPLTIPAGMDPKTASMVRLDAIHDLMRMEMPERWSDVYDPPARFGYAGAFPGPYSVARPALNQSYNARYAAGSPSDEFQNAECLYLIIMNAPQDEADERSVIKPEYIADTDGDGFPEIIDAWGTPIRFLRWAPGFKSDLHVVATAKAASTSTGPPYVITSSSSQLAASPGTYNGGAIVKEDPTRPGYFSGTNTTWIQDYKYTAGSPGVGTFNCFDARSSFSMSAGETFFILQPDPFDPRHTYDLTTYALYPLIYSAGPNKCFGIVSDIVSPPPANAPLRYSQSGLRSNPFKVPPTSLGEVIGMQMDRPKEPNFVTDGWLDNITNHAITSK